jgi:hypothetical protein
MRFEWVIFKEYDDGSVSNSCDLIVYRDNGQVLDDGWISDHTRPDAKEDDAKTHREVPYAYDVHGLDRISKDSLRKVCLRHGLAEGDYGSCGFWGFGICRNTNYNKSRFTYVGVPRVTVEEAMQVVEEAFAESFKFDYDAEIQEALDQINARKELMDEGVAFLRERYKE